MAKNDLELTKDAYLKLLTKYLDNAQEERDLALDRYRRQDEMILTAEDFIFQGKNNVSFLTLASNRSDSVLKVAEKLQAILFKNEEKTENSSALTDDFRRQIAKQIREIDENPNSSMDIEENNTEK